MRADVLIYLGVVATLWIAYLIGKHRRRGGNRRFGDADAYEGNLIIPAAGASHGLAGHRAHGGHIGPESGHGPENGHDGYGGHAGHCAAGDHH